MTKVTHYYIEASFEDYQHLYHQPRKGGTAGVVNLLWSLSKNSLRVDTVNPEATAQWVHQMLPKLPIVNLNELGDWLTGET